MWCEDRVPRSVPSPDYIYAPEQIAPILPFRRDYPERARGCLSLIRGTRGTPD